MNVSELHFMHKIAVF